MKTLTLLSLAAGAALLPTMAVAQPGPRAGGGAGVTWRGGGAQVGGGAHMRTPIRVPGGGGQWRGGGHGGGAWTGGGGHFRGGWWGGGVRMPRFRPGQGFPRRLTRGGFIHPYWFGPQFYIQNWQGYGFADPGADQRWVRYYDDAYLIDRGGRVVDAREGLDWDRYGERWEVEDGVPSYYGRNDFQPDDEDYAYVERRGGDAHAGSGRGDGRDRDDDDDDDDGEGRGHHDRDGHGHGGQRGAHHDRDGHGHGAGYGGGAYGYGAVMPGYGGPMPVAPGAPGMVYGGAGGTTTAVYGGGYGYGMYAYPIIIETTTTTAGASNGYVEIIEEVIETRRPRRRVRRGCNCRPARPPAGERG